MYKTIIRALIWAAIALLLIYRYANAQTPITACGTIAAPGQYQLAGNITAAGTCLTVTAPNVSIEGNVSANITGNGTGTGILVTATASNFSYTSMDNSVISGFAIGIEVDADSASLFIANDVSLVGITNCTQGIFLNGATNARVDPGIQATDIGILIQGGSSNEILHVDQGSGPITAGTRGIIIQSSVGNLVRNVVVNAADIGVIVRFNSRGNTITNNNVTTDDQGIRIRYESPRNFVSNNSVQGPNQLFQGTANGGTSCNGNFWFGNITTDPQQTYNQQCIVNP